MATPAQNISEQVRELGKLRLDFSGEKCFPSEIQRKLGDPELFNSPELLNFTTSTSTIARILHENPANDAMLRIVYYDESDRPVTSGLDHWLSHSLSGQALRDRLIFCSDWIAKHMFRGNKKVFDLGGGSASYFFEALKYAKYIKAIPTGFQWICRDIDSTCLDIGRERAISCQLDNTVHFEEANFMSSKCFPSDEEKGDFVVLIGVLCGMDREMAIRCLKSCHAHLKPGGEILAATLLIRSFEEDPLLFRVLCNVGGWQLRPKKMETVVEIFKEAGFTIKEIMSERPSGEGQYAIIHAIA